MSEKLSELSPSDELFLDIGMGLIATVTLLKMPDPIYDIAKQSNGLEALEMTFEKAPDEIKNDSKYILSEYFRWVESMRELRESGK